MKAVKILMVLCKSDFREKKTALLARGWEDWPAGDAKYKNIKIFPSEQIAV